MSFVMGCAPRRKCQVIEQRLSLAPARAGRFTGLGRMLVGFALLGVFAIVSLPSPAAVIETEALSDPALVARYRHLIDEYRCPKCQNQNLAESDSPISKDLRSEIRRMLEEGASDAEISEFLVARYGEFILYRPAFHSGTYVLWLAPLAFVALGALILVAVVKRRRRSQAPGLQAEEREQLQALLGRAAQADQLDKPQ